MPLRAAFPRVPVVPVQAEPSVRSAQTSQALFGQYLLVLGVGGAAGDWRQVRTVRDGYEGWAHAGYLDEYDFRSLDALVASDPDVFAPAAERRWYTPAADDAPADAPVAPDPDDPAPALGLISLGCVVAWNGRELHLPVGAFVHPSPATRLLAGDTLTVGADDPRFAQRGTLLVETAARYFASTSYQWGGVTPWGADCSGLVQTAYTLHGVGLPRDAWQQAGVGQDAGTDLRAHHPGDLLFFSDRDDRRVTHVGLATGDGAMCHLALGRGGWAVDALAEPQDAYAERLASQLVAARRVFR
mgnify:CR=1 FL=1